MSAKNSRRLHEAYSAAWVERDRTGDWSPTVLIEALQDARLEGLDQPGPARDLVVALWEQGTPPERLDLEFRRAYRAMAGEATRAIGRATAEIIKAFRTP